MPTDIGWTDESNNAITGCSKKSEGCRFCYAERISREYGWTKFPWTATYAQQNIQFHPERLKRIYEWKSPRMIFANSMSDMFHELVLPEWIEQIFKVMRDCSWHTFQVLTKRPERAALWEFPDNCWIGTSVEDARVVDRIDVLRKTKAKTRFISFEPLLGSVGKVDLADIHWVIVGGESGPNFRKMDHTWAREIRDQAVAANIPFFFKQDSAVRPGIRPYLQEVAGPPTEWKQYPQTTHQGGAAPKKSDQDSGKQMELF